jgi:hypothetical protein
VFVRLDRAGCHQSGNRPDMIGTANALAGALCAPVTTASPPRCDELLIGCDPQYLAWMPSRARYAFTGNRFMVVGKAGFDTDAQTW